MNARCPTCNSPYGLFGAYITVCDLNNRRELRVGVAKVCAMCKSAYLVTPEGVLKVQGFGMEPIGPMRPPSGFDEERTQSLVDDLRPQRRVP